MQPFGNLSTALREADGFDAYILDGRPHSSTPDTGYRTRSTPIIIPTGQTKDDLRPAVQLAHSLVDAGISVRSATLASSCATIPPPPRLRCGSRILGEVDARRSAIVTRDDVRLLGQVATEVLHDPPLAPWRPTAIGPEHPPGGGISVHTRPQYAASSSRESMRSAMSPTHSSASGRVAPQN